MLVINIKKKKYITPLQLKYLDIACRHNKTHIRHNNGYTSVVSNPSGFDDNYTHVAIKGDTLVIGDALTKLRIKCSVDDYKIMTDVTEAINIMLQTNEKPKFMVLPFTYEVYRETTNFMIMLQTLNLGYEVFTTNEGDNLLLTVEYEYCNEKRFFTCISRENAPTEIRLSNKEGKEFSFSFYDLSEVHIGFYKQLLNVVLK